MRYKITDRGGERTVAEAAFPIVIGAGPAAAIQIAGLKAGAEAAYIGLSQQRPFVQPGHADVAVRYNDKKLEDSAWLMHGDRLEIGACEIKFEAEGPDFIIRVVGRKSGAAAPGPPPADRPEPAFKIEPLSFRADPGRRRAASARRYWRLIGPAVALGFFLLLAAGWFVFTARQITIQITPPPDDISIGGSLIAPRIGGHYLLRPGTYELQAFKACYAPLKRLLEVGPQKSQTVRFQMQKLPGRIAVRTHPSGRPATELNGARLSIDGQAIGVTPVANLEVDAGRRILEIRADQYQDLKTDVQIAGCEQEQTFDFALIPGWSEVFVSSVPPGATVTIDGEPAGKTPVTLELSEGDYRLEISAEGFKTWQSRLAVAPNQAQSIKDVQLQAADGTLALQTTPSGANVTIGQKFAGKTPLKVPLPANAQHEIRISKAGYQNVTRTVGVSSGKLKKLTVALKPVLGVIYFAVEPADALLIVDGKRHGPVPPKLKLVAVSHRLEIKKSGYETFQTRITPRPGYPQEIRATLRPSRSQPAAAGVVAAQNGYRLKLIRPQSFTMGSSRREQGRRSNETLRKIDLRRPFYMGLREVTNKEFKQFLAGHNSGTFSGRRLSGDDHPVVRVTWEQAALFCNWLSGKESLPPVYVKKGDRLVAAEPIGTGYRLPTEAEWEYCARFTNNPAGLKYPWGSRFPPTTPAGNYGDASAKTLLPAVIENYQDGYPATAPPAQFKANDLGLYDLGGNVAEWCHDFYTIYSYNSSKTDVDPSGPPQGDHHVVKGSSWKHASMSKLRLAYRDYSNGKRPDLGFRISRYAK